MLNTYTYLETLIERERDLGVLGWGVFISVKFRDWIAEATNDVATEFILEVTLEAS